MKKLTLAVACVLGLFTVAQSQAAGTDINDMTCSHLLEVAGESEEVGGLLVFWLDGYLSGVTGDTTFDSEIIQSFANNLGEACASKPDAKLLAVAKEVGIE